jgi:hypothetical protein
LNRAEQVHDRRCAGAAHAEIDDRDAAGCGVQHWAVHAPNLDIVPFREHADVITEVDEKNVFAQLRGGSAGITRKPILNDFLFRVHARGLAAK